MRKILVFFLCAASFTSYGQKRSEFDTSFVSYKLNDFFSNNPSVQKVGFFFNHQGRRESSIFKISDSSKKRTPEYYNFNFIGDKFIFEKRYGGLSFPDEEIQTVLKNRCLDNFYLNITATLDSVKLHLTHYCNKKREPEDEDEIVFTKVEIYGGYKGGAQQLEKRIQSVLVQNYPSNNYEVKDSSLVYEVIIDKTDSCLKEVTLFYGKDSEFSHFILNQLKSACRWWPPLQGGRAVKAWRRIFVKLNKDHTLTIKYPED